MLFKHTTCSQTFVFMIWFFSSYKWQRLWFYYWRGINHIRDNIISITVYSKRCCAIYRLPMENPYFTELRTHRRYRNIPGCFICIFRFFFISFEFESQSEWNMQHRIWLNNVCQNAYHSWTCFVSKYLFYQKNLRKHRLQKEYGQQVMLGQPWFVLNASLWIHRGYVLVLLQYRVYKSIIYRTIKKVLY